MALLFLVPLILMFTQGESYEEPVYIAITLAILMFVEGVVLLVSNNFAVSVLVTGTLFELLYLINDIVFQCRGNYLTFSDFLCAGVAFSVAGRYSIYFSSTMLRCLIAQSLLLVVCVTLLATHYGKFPGKQNGRVRGIIIIALTGITLYLVDLSSYMGYYYYFDELGRKYGLVGTLFTEMQQTGVAKPEGYDSREIKGYLAETGTQEVPAEYPNIIVVMDEALSDFSLVGDLKTDTDPLPFLHEMAAGQGQSDRIAYGRMYAPVWGGTTVNTEWEFLTGMSLRHCPSAIPFLQFTSSDYEYNLVRNLKQYGYKAYAFHPYYEAGYNRRQVYERMGFDDMTFIESLDPEYRNMRFDERPSDDKTNAAEGMYIRNLISDEYDLDYVLDWYEANKGNGPLFMFNVTMQNHGPYNLEGYENTVHLNDSMSGKVDTEQYLSVISRTDAAIRKLIDYFETCNDPTVILVFGDHQPNVDEAFYKNLFDTKNIGPEIEHLKYVTPYLMWTNFDTEMPDGSDISSNFLAEELLGAAKVPRNSWFRVNSEFHNSFNVFSPHLLEDSAGNIIDSLTESTERIDRLYNGFTYYMLYQ